MNIIEKVCNGKDAGYMKTYSVILNPEDNGGERVTLSVDVFDNGDGLPDGLFSHITLETQSNGASSSSIKLFSTIFEDVVKAVNNIQSKISELKT
jgi:nitrogen-specific signal transduction histidine kinase